MKQLSATFEIDLPSGFLVHFPEDHQPQFRMTSPPYEVELSFLAEGPLKFWKKDDLHPKRTIQTLKVKVTNEEHASPPPRPKVGLATDEVRLWFEYFGSRLPGYQRAAAEAVNRAINYFRYRLRTPFLRPVSYQDQTFQNPSWSDDEGDDLGKGERRYMVRDVPGLTGSKMGVTHFTMALEVDLSNALQTPIEPELYEEYLMDAQASVFSDDLPRAVLGMAIACEIAAKETFFSVSTPAEAAFEYLEDKRNLRVQVVELIDVPAEQAFGESFRNVNQKAFDLIECLFRCRNKVAHRGILTYRDQQKHLRELDRTTAEQWWEAADKLIGWLRNHQEKGLPAYVEPGRRQK